MAHYAKLGINNKVIFITPLDTSYCLNADGIEDEEVGRQYLERTHGWPLWVKTSYNTREGKHYTEKELSVDQSKAFRGNFAIIGGYFDEKNNIFLPQKPYDSWTLDLVNARWTPPVTKPNSVQKRYTENDQTKFYYVMWDNNGLRWLGSKIDKNINNMTVVWNTNTNSWDNL